MELNEQQLELKRFARELADREFRPRASRWDENEEWPEENVQIMAKQGLTGLTVPEKYGGAGCGDVEATIVLEQIARVCLSTAVSLQLFLNGPPRAIATLGTEDQRERWLPMIASGECLVGIAMTEPDAGSAAMQMRARLNASTMRLNAYKNMVTGGHKAGAYFVVTRFTREGEDATKAIGAVMVPSNTKGVSVSKVHRKMGLRGAAEAEIAFDDVLVSGDEIVVDGDAAGKGVRTIMAQFNHERLGNAAMCTGVASGALDESIRYAQERTAGGTRLIDIQAIAHKLAEMSTKVEASRLMVQRAASTGTHGPSGAHEPDPLAVAQAKWYANIIAQEVCSEAIQIHGGYGYTREFPVERMYRDVRGLAIGAGTVEVQKNLIAKLLDKQGHA
ncbi:MAG: acyl-CoA dehydrogenase family protein [Actinomycetota bacterium]